MPVQFRVVVPKDVKAGDKIRVKCPDGTAADTIIPPGHRGGDAFLIEFPVEQLKSPQRTLDAVLEYSTSSIGIISSMMEFLSRRITGSKDIILTIFIACIIVYWTVIGFFFGVLYATRDMLILVKQVR